MNTKPVYILPEWLQFIFATVDLKLLRQISTARILLQKSHTEVEVSEPMVYWVINTNIAMKMSSTPL